MARTVAVITGASSGIGLEFARQLAQEYDLVLVARRRDRLEEIAAEFRAAGTGAEVIEADLTDADDVERVARRLREEPRLGLLVNNAGFGAGGYFWKASLEDQERMHTLHIMATLRLSHAALGNLTAQGAGAVINVASVAAFVGRAGSVCYGATKAWMTYFTEGLALDLKAAGSKVTVQALCPGFTYSEFHDVLGMDRTRVAGKSLWLTAEQVVSDSLRALRTGTLFVVPGWRYKAIVAVLPRLPASWRAWLVGSRARRQEAK
jgi:short-subunit dehydrogenase